MLRRDNAQSWEVQLEGGQIGEKAFFINGKVEGDYLFYDKTGKIIKKETYKNGNLLSTEEFEKVEEDKNESEGIKN